MGLEVKNYSCVFVMLWCTCDHLDNYFLVDMTVRLRIWGRLRGELWGILA